MAIKFKKENPVRSRLVVYNVKVYKQRSLSFFLISLCIVMFFGGAYFLINRDSKRNLVYTEGLIVKKTPLEQNLESTSKGRIQFITIKFAVRSGRQVEKDVWVDSDSYDVLKEGDIIPVLYHYNPLLRDVEIVSYGRYPLRNYLEGKPSQ